ncbi:MAG: Superfamily II DNA or RNA helicase, SNF2 family [Verrucomicrobia bacterium]|nr:MAG: Superfamily II DNA or RNA helicase, SNF2 family [Verrucomicrobiota bacterium]
MNPESVKIGMRVRVIGAPERQGTIASAPRTNDGRCFVKVDFDGGVRNNTPVENLEPLPSHWDVIEEVAAGRFQPPEGLRRNLLHEKLNGRLTEIIYSMDASKTNFLAYQFKPVLRLLESPTNSLLIADEVGLGKTIEAGLIWTELRAREAAQTLLVVCPPHLVTKWRVELKNRFGVDSVHANASMVLEKLAEAERHEGPGFALVASYHGLRPPSDLDESTPGPAAELARRLDAWADADEPFLDLLIMDEAAIMRNDNSQISKLGGLLAPVAKHKVYLSATPLHTRSANLHTLLRRLDPDTFGDRHNFEAILQANEPLVNLRRVILSGRSTKAELLAGIDTAQRSPLLTGNNTLAALRTRVAGEENLSDPKIRAELAHQSERANLLSYIVTRSRKRDVEQHPVVREVNTVSVNLRPEEQAFYDDVTKLVHRYTDERGLSAGFLTVMPQRQVASSMAAACRRLQAVEAANRDDDLSPDSWNSNTTPAGPLIQSLQEWLAGRHSARWLRDHDSKYTCFRNAIVQYWADHPNHKVVLFAYFKPTLYYLAERLREEGIASLMLTGDEAGDTQAIVDEFAKPESARILLSSEVGGEGLDLQFASVLVNYDLPWNPMVVEQRIGRIHRIGQKADRIVVINMICAGTVDERIYDRLYSRLDLFRRTLGDLEAVIGPVINELTRDLLSHRLDPQQQSKRIDSTAVALEGNLLLEEELEKNASVLAAYGDFVINQIAAAHQRGEWIKAEDLETYVLGFFRNSFPATRIQGLDPHLRLFEFELDTLALHEFDAYLGLHRLRSQSRIATPGRRRVVFDHRIFIKPPPHTELVHQAHPLIRFISYYLRMRRAVQPVAVAAEIARELAPAGIPSGLYAFVSQRWSVEGMRSYDRLHHEVINLETMRPFEEDAHAAALVEIAAALGYPAAAAPMPGEELLSILTQVVQDLEDAATSAFNRFYTRCEDENEDRQQIQLRGVDGFMARREELLRAVQLKHINAGRRNLVAATEGKLEALRQKCAQQRHKIMQNRTRSDGPSTIAAGFILVR